jgi:predicted RNA-binding protein YlxR (DUF448 family)
MTETDVNNAPVVKEQDMANTADTANQQETKQEVNFRALRESKENLERVVAEKDRIIAEMQRAKTPVRPSYISGDPDDLTTNKQLEDFDREVMKKVEKMLVAVKYPDAHELINKYGNEIPPKLFIRILEAQDLEAGIEAIKMTEGYIRDHAKEHINVAKAIENANKPKSTLNAGGTASVSKGTQYANMTPQERLQMQDKWIRGYN